MKNNSDKQKTVTNMVDVNSNILIISSNGNGLHTLIKRTVMGIKDLKRQLYIIYNKLI